MASVAKRFGSDRKWNFRWRGRTYSDLDTTRLESDLWAKFGFGKSLFLYGDWPYVDYADDAPYLYDTSGEISWYTLSLGWSF